MKRILSIVLAVIMVFSMTAMVSARPVYDNNYFYPVDNDYHNHYVTDGYNFYDIFDSENRTAIEYLYTMGILQGYGNGYYGPARTLTRAEACAIITRMMVENYDIYAYRNDYFTDVADNAWYREYVDTAHREGYMNGYGNHTFGPEDEVTYAQFATIVLNMLGYDCVSLDGTWPANVERIARYLGLYNGVRYFVSENAITRGAVAQMLYNALDCNMVYRYGDKITYTGMTLREFVGDFDMNDYRYNKSAVKVSQVADYNIHSNFVEFKLAEDGLKDTWTKCAISAWDFNIGVGSWVKVTYNYFGEVENVEFLRYGHTPEVAPAYVTGIVEAYDAGNYIQLDGKGTHYIATGCVVNGVVEIGCEVTIKAVDAKIVEIVVNKAPVIETTPDLPDPSDPSNGADDLIDDMGNTNTPTPCWYVEGGKCYHLDKNCSYIVDSETFVMSLEDAINNSPLVACSKCGNTN